MRFSNTIADILSDYMAILSADFSASYEYGTSSVVLSTPFLDWHNDAIEIYVENLGSGIRLFDNGEAISDLRHSGLDIEVPEACNHLKAILNGFGVSLKDDVIQVESSYAEAGEALHRIIQAVIGVSYLRLLARAGNEKTPIINNGPQNV